jgi:N-acetylglutamate synthase-like GNAT family acetyltransferase
MNPAPFLVRRANVDDLGGLIKLWERAGLPALELEKHLTEFQLAATTGGELIGGVGLRVHAKQGWLHSEAFTHPEQADEARGQLWQRLQTLARNHGLVRIWTQESAPFWTHSGFVEPSAELQQKLPPAFNSGTPGRWLVLPFREETVEAISLDKEFELFQQSQRAATEEVLSQARKLKTLAYVVALVVAVAAIIGGIALIYKVTRPPATAPETNQPPSR